jgi:tetratricopeptide (TPR) repeat protein
VKIISSTRPGALWFLVALCLLLSACASAPEVNPLGSMASLSSVPTSAQPWQDYFSGRSDQARAGFAQAAEAATGKEAKAQLWFGQAESAWLSGHYGESTDAHVKVVVADPASPLAAWSLQRLEALRFLSDHPDERISPAVEAYLKAHRDPAVQVPVANRLHGAVLASWLERRAWSRSQSLEFFDASRHGLAADWRVVGPLSPWSRLDFDRETEPERDARLADSYDVNGFSRRSTELRSAWSPVKMPQAEAGIYVLETWLTLDRPQVVDISTMAQGLALLKVDGEAIWRRDDREGYPPLRAWVQGVELSAGTHRLLLRVAHSPNYKNYFGVVVLPRHGGASMQFSAQPPQDMSAGALASRGEVRRWMGEDFSASALGQDRLRLLLAARRAAWASDEAAALDALEALEPLSSSSGALWGVWADLWSGRWSAPGDIRNRETLAALRRGLEADPGAHHLRLWLARLMRQQKRKDDALAQLQIPLREIPEEKEVWEDAADYYRWRGFYDEEEQALSMAAKLDPSNCEVASSLYDAWRRRDYTPSEVAAPWLECTSIQQRLARDKEVLQGDAEAYLFHMKRATLLYPESPGTWRTLARGLRQFEGAGAALEVVNQGIALHPEDSLLALLKADLLLEEGKPKEAQAAVQALLKEDASAGAAHRLLALMEGHLPLSELMINGKEAIAEYERREHERRGESLGSSSFYALDYMAQRFFEDGSQISLVHLVVGVLSKDGINEHGEVSFPRGAVPLMAHTVKRDGRVIEPRRQQGKSTLSMEGLEPGDYVEYAYLTMNRQRQHARGAVQGGGFFFRMTDIASARSEYVLELPKGWEPQIIEHNGAPKPEVSAQGDWTRYRFLTRHSTEARPEPYAVQKEEYLPYVQFLHEYGWEEAHRYMQERLASAQALSASLRRRSQQVVRGAAATNPRQKAEALFDFVNKHVRKPSFRDFSTDASHVEMSGQGNPVVLLQALLKAQGISSQVVVLRPRSQEPEDTAWPDFSKYSFTCLRAQVGQQVMWLNPAGRYTPFGRLPWSVQGVPGIVLEPGASLEPVQSPTFEDQTLRHVNFDMRLDKDGDLSGTIVETLEGYNAKARREYYEELGGEDKIRQFVEKNLNYDISGAELLGWKIINREDVDAPLRLEMSFVRASYARQGEGGKLIIEDRYDMPDLGRRYGRLPRREQAILTRHHNHEVVWKLQAPEGRQIKISGQEQVAYESDFGYYHLDATSQGRVLTMNQRLYLPLQRVPVEDYQPFSDWADDTSRGTYMRIEVSQP